MKRANPDCDVESAHTAASQRAKRHKSHLRQSKARRARASLTREALSALEEPPCDGVLIDRWLDTAGKSMDSRPRLRPMHRRSKQSRTPSPVKKPPHCATPEYRNGTMKLAMVYVERDYELPAHVATYVERILQTATSVVGHGGSEDTFVADLANSYRIKSQSLASDCVGEGEWRSSIYSGLIDPLSRRWSPVLKSSASEKPWNRCLKPTVPQWNVAIDFSATIASPIALANSPAFPTPSATASCNEPSSSSAVSVTASDASVDDKLQLSTPKPDVAVGLASDAIKNALKLPEDFLLRLQTDPNIPQPFCSDPHQVPLGLRFPFLIVEAKGSNTGGNLIHAQNQAAVAAASALNILEDLDNRTTSAADADVVETSPWIIFSAVTEGPTHELWVHYKTGSEYDMHCLQSCRATLPGQAGQFAGSLDRILEWGAGSFKEDIVQRVGTLWRGMCAPREWD